jgi:hypothetical protein
MSVVVATIELGKGARLLTEAIYMYIREFGQPVLLTIPPMQYPLALFLLFEQLCLLVSV